MPVKKRSAANPSPGNTTKTVSATQRQQTKEPIEESEADEDVYQDDDDEPLTNDEDVSAEEVDESDDEEGVEAGEGGDESVDEDDDNDDDNDTEEEEWDEEGEGIETGEEEDEEDEEVDEVGGSNDENGDEDEVESENEYAEPEEEVNEEVESEEESDSQENDTTNDRGKNEAEKTKPTKPRSKRPATTKTTAVPKSDKASSKSVPRKRDVDTTTPKAKPTEGNANHSVAAKSVKSDSQKKSTGKKAAEPESGEADRAKGTPKKKTRPEAKQSSSKKASKKTTTARTLVKASGQDPDTSEEFNEADESLMVNPPTSDNEGEPGDDAVDPDVKQGSRPSSILFKGEATRTKVKCPSYTSWSKGVPSKNKYRYYYYYSKNAEKGKWELEAHDSKNMAMTRSSRFENSEFAAEHIFELQQIADLLSNAKIRDNKEKISEVDGVKYAFSKKYPALRNQHKTALDHLYSALPSRPEDFVYLEKRVNNMKGTYFRRARPEVLKSPKKPVIDPKSLDREDIERAIMETHLVYLYLKNPHVAQLYRDISVLVRQTWVEIGECFGESKIAVTKGLYQGGSEVWDGAYDNWEETFLTDVEDNMNASLDTGLKYLDALAKAEPKLKKEVQAIREKVEDKRVDLSRLKRHGGQKEVPDADAKMMERLEKAMMGVTLIDEKDESGP